MVIQISPETEATIRDLISRGDYEDEEAVVAEALRVLVERDKVERLRALIAVAEEQAARGQVKELTPDLLDRLKREAAENVRMDTPYKDEAIP